MIKKNRSFTSQLFRVLKIGAIFFFSSTVIITIVYRFVPPPVTPLMVMRVIGQVADGKELKMSKKWVPFSEISPNLVKAVITSEDNKFMEHNGVDFAAIEKARK